MSGNATQLLTLASRGDQAAAARLTPLVYDELRALAARYLGRAGAADDPILQPTALVHEAYLRLVDRKTADFHSRTHFYAVAAAAIRHVLIDHLRAGNRAKRGRDWQRTTLADAPALTNSAAVDSLVLDESLSRLAELDARAARVVELRFFGGLTEREVAEVLGVSERTVRNDWSMARAWLRCELDSSGEADRE